MIWVAKASILSLSLLISLSLLTWVFPLYSRFGERPAKKGSKTVRPEDIQKQYLRVFIDRYLLYNLYLFLALCFLISPVASFAGNKTNTGDELVSLTAKDEPLGYVLKKISMATGYEIVLDHNWQNYLVSVTLDEVPLDKALKRILKDLNNVIVYVSRKKIKIIIYDKMSPERGSPAPSNEKAFIPPGRSFRHPEPGLPGSQAIEREEAPPGTSAVSGGESETGVSDNDDTQNKTPENLKTKTDKGAQKNLENKSSKRRLEQNNPNESSSGEEPESSQ
jgi:hypothetical protein